MAIIRWCSFWSFPFIKVVDFDATNSPNQSVTKCLTWQGLLLFLWQMLNVECWMLNVEKHWEKKKTRNFILWFLILSQNKNPAKISQATISFDTFFVCLFPFKWQAKRFQFRFFCFCSAFFDHSFVTFFIWYLRIEDINSPIVNLHIVFDFKSALSNLFPHADDIQIQDCIAAKDFWMNFKRIHIISYI